MMGWAAATLVVIGVGSTAAGLMDNFDYGTYVVGAFAGAVSAQFWAGIASDGEVRAW